MRKSITLPNLVAVLLLLVDLILSAPRNGGPNVTLVLNETLNGEPSNHYPVTIVLTSSGNAMQVNFFAPYLGSEAVQSIHIFVANEDKHITELEIDREEGLDTKTKLVVRMYWAPFNVLRKIDTFTAKSQVVNETWSGIASLPVSYLPPTPSLVNAAVKHQVNNDTHWENFYSITNAGIAIPDLMVLARYKVIDPSILSSDTSYSPEWRPN